MFLLLLLHSVGRLEVTEEQFSEPSNNTALEEALRQCYHEGTKLVYLFEPTIFIFPPPVVNMTGIVAINVSRCFFAHSNAIA